MSFCRKKRKILGINRRSKWKIKWPFNERLRLEWG